MAWWNLRDMGRLTLLLGGRHSRVHTLVFVVPDLRANRQKPIAVFLQLPDYPITQSGVPSKPDVGLLGWNYPISR
jgi:hypothetical protein